MGQAWCKEKTSKAQDSKSPLDRVFVRCAHRIYPSLKEEGSVLGGATQRVTSSEIGYAGSPPREVLTRGRSIDSVDRPFHPSDWVDVNLEVPSPPRASSALTNSTVDTSLHPATTPTSSCSNLKDVTPVPPPRRKKRNRGRPLPPKPDEIPENVTNNLRRGDTSEEPLYFSVRSPKTSSNDQNGDVETRGTEKICTEDAKHEGRRMKEIFEHKVNGTGRIISSEVVSGKRTSVDKKTSRISESGHHWKVLENEEYERFAQNQSIKDSSTPNRQDRRRSKELEKRIRDSSRDDDRPEANTRTKNYSTVSLPNYDELDVSRHPTKSTAKDERGGAGEKMKSRRPVRSSTGSLPVESFLSPFSEKTSVRFEDYVPRRGSIEHLSPYQVLGKLGSSENEVTDGGFMKYDPSKLEDWDLSDISNCDSNRRLSAENLPRIEIHNDVLVERGLSEGIDVVDHSQNIEPGEAETIEVKISCVHRDMISPLQKPESFGKEPSPILDPDRELRNPDDWFTDQNRSLGYFDPPKMSEIGQISTCELATSPTRREPFFLNEELHRSTLDTIGGSCRNGAVVRESDRSDQSRLIFGRSLSNESEPYDDPYESKELHAHSDIANKLIRTISEESLPQEMLEGVDEEIVDFFDEKLAKDTTNKLKKDCQDQRVKTPPPSPEPKIKAQILENDHSTLLKVLNDEAADGSNLSSMTPSLTELEVALSDMLEKENQPDETTKGENTDEEYKQGSVEKLLEPDIVPVEKHNAIDRSVSDQHRSTSDGILVDGTPEHKTDQMSVSLEQILEDSKSTPKKRKVSFCTWEEKIMTDVDLKSGEESEVPKHVDEATSPDSKNSVVTSEIGSNSDFFKDIETNMKDSTWSIGEAPEKPSRLFQNLEDVAESLEQIPTPPRRKNKSFGVTKESVRTIERYPEDPDPRPNDRLI